MFSVIETANDLAFFFISSTIPGVTLKSDSFRFYEQTDISIMHCRRLSSKSPYSLTVENGLKASTILSLKNGYRDWNSSRENIYLYLLYGWNIGSSLGLLLLLVFSLLGNDRSGSSLDLADLSIFDTSDSDDSGVDGAWHAVLKR